MQAAANDDVVPYDKFCYFHFTALSFNFSDSKVAANNVGTIIRGLWVEDCSCDCPCFAKQGGYHLLVASVFSTLTTTRKRNPTLLLEMIVERKQFGRSCDVRDKEVPRHSLLTKRQLPMF
jgi:hypothetical protein